MTGGQDEGGEKRKWAGQGRKVTATQGRAAERASREEQQQGEAEENSEVGRENGVGVGKAV